MGHLAADGFSGGFFQSRKDSCTAGAETELCCTRFQETLNSYSCTLHGFIRYIVIVTPYMTEKEITETCFFPLKLSLLGLAFALGILSGQKMIWVTQVAGGGPWLGK